MKTTAEKIAVMQAYDEGKKIKTEFDFGTSTTFLVKNVHGELEWDWKHSDYEIVEEPKQIVKEKTPFDISDYEPLIGQLFRNIFIEGIEAEVKGMLVGIVGDEISIGTVKYSVPLFSSRLEWYNKEIRMWLSCMKTVNN